jgi:hypothetical protein
MTLTRRGSTYHLDTALGERRVRCSLGVRDLKAAERLENRVQFALSDGPKSEVWPALKQVLPPSSYHRRIQTQTNTTLRLKGTQVYKSQKIVDVTVTEEHGTCAVQTRFNVSSAIAAIHEMYGAPKWDPNDIPSR